MSNGFFEPRGYYEINPDGSYKQKIENNSPVLGEYLFIPQWTKSYLTWPMDSTVSLISKRSWFSLATGWYPIPNVHVWFIGKSNDTTPLYIEEFDVSLEMNVRHVWLTPTGTDSIGVRWLPGGDCPLAWAIEIEGI